MMDPEEAIHVGDGLIEDVQGATNSGIMGIHIDRDGEGGEVPGHQIKNLRELMPLLK